MNTFIEGRLAEFKTNFNGLSKEQQDKMIQDYTGPIFTKGRRSYCEVVALNLAKQINMKVWQLIIAELADEVQWFLDSRKNQVFPKWQQWILQWLKEHSK